LPYRKLDRPQLKFSLGNTIETDSTYEEFDRAKFTARSRLWVATVY